MLVRDIRRLAFIVGPVLVLFVVGLKFYSQPSGISSLVDDWIEPTLGKSDPAGDHDLSEEQAPLVSSDSNFPFGKDDAKDNKPDPLTPDETTGGFWGVAPEPSTSDPISDPSDLFPPLSSDAPSLTDGAVAKVPGAGDGDIFHHEVFSSSTLDKKFFLIDFGDQKAMNPNIIPHPTLENTWIVVAQRFIEGSTFKFAELVCNAAFKDGALTCTHPATVLPVAATAGGNCEGDLSYFNWNVGPHDARVLVGPDAPYIVYGSNSAHVCFGQWIQDFRMLVEDFNMTGPGDFRMGTELQRPLPWNKIEKNWFPFWDSKGQMYVHNDIAPKRVFAKLNLDGSVGDNLAPLASSDEQCIAKYMPKLAPELESLHQATNSLKVTLCKRADSSCTPNESNTFLFTIYQYKTYYGYHSVYEPYVMMFQQRVPFEINAMSKRPIWIHGREKHPERDTSDMFYVTSMNWKSPGLNYHGYLDDEIFIAFGIEDEKAAGIDVLAGDLLGDLGLCNEL